MAVRRTVTKPGLYFITFTCHNWLSLIELSGGYNAVYKWFDYLKTKGHYITGYVIMPNHLASADISSLEPTLDYKELPGPGGA